jgi:protein phosphatase
LLYGVFTDQGKRARNEDAVVCHVVDDDQLLAIVADGMGGGIDGKRFSDSAVDRVQATFISSTEPTGRQRLDAAVRVAITDLNTLRKSDPRYIGSGSTLVTAHILAQADGAEVTYLHVGDSPIFLVSAANRRARQLMIDHTYAEALIRAGVAKEEALRHVQGEQLTHVLGAELDLATVPGYADQRTVIMQPNDRLILCSDGISKHLTLEELATLALASPPPEAARQIAQRALKNGSKDNVTALVIQCQPVRRSLRGLLALILAGMLLIGLGVGGTIFAQAYFTATPPPVPIGANASVTPLPPTSTREPTATTDPAAAPIPTSTEAPSITTTPTPTNTPTNTPLPTRTRTPTRTPTISNTGAVTETNPLPTPVTEPPPPPPTPVTEPPPLPATVPITEPPPLPATVPITEPPPLPATVPITETKLLTP